MSDVTSAPAPAAAPASSEPAQAQTTENSSEAKQGGQEQPATPTSNTAPKKKAPSFRKFKIGDEEVSLSDEDIARDYSKWKGADAKARETAEARKGIEAFMKRLEEDPEAVLSDKRLAFNKKELAQKWLMEQIESELNPPDPRDKKLTDAERRLKEYEDRERQETEAEEQRQLNSLVEQRKAAISNVLHQAMQSTHLSKHPESAAATLREMALYMRAAKERGEEVTPDELVEHIHNNRFHQMYSLAHQLEGEELIEFFGEEIVKRIRKADLTRLKASREPQATHRNETWAPASKKPGKTMDSWEAKEHARKLLLK